MKKIYFFLTMALALFAQGIWAQAVSQTFNASGTYTVPVGYSAIVVVEAWGGGGSGGGGGAANGDRAGGGGGGYARVSYTLAAGSYAVTVGAGGIAPAASGVGQNGGNSIFAGPVTSLVAFGGTAGSNVNPGGAGGTGGSGPAGVVTHAGGAGGNRSNVSGGGGGGGSALAGANGSNGAAGVNAVGGAGGAGTGAGGAGGNNNAVSANGIAPGAGGGGKGANAATSGNGAAGRVVVTVTSSGPLPIKIYYFNAGKGTNVNTLNWQAECSSTQATFVIERSADGRNFTTINSITANQARCAQPFTYDDASASALAGTNFYRIKMIDIDGRETYTAIVKVGGQAKDMQLAGVLPNPVSTTAQLNITTSKKDKVDLAIISTEGKVVSKSTVQVQSGSTIVNLDVSGLSVGAYFVKGIFSDGQTNTIKFIKQ